MSLLLITSTCNELILRYYTRTTDNRLRDFFLRLHLHVISLLRPIPNTMTMIFTPYSTPVIG